MQPTGTKSQKTSRRASDDKETVKRYHLRDEELSTSTITSLTGSNFRAQAARKKDNCSMMKSAKATLLMIGSLPPPAIGPSIAMKRLLQGENLRNAFDLILLDIS